MLESRLFDRLAPVIFVVMWSTGWVVAGAAAPYADPLAILAVRHAATVAALLPFVLIVGAPFPTRPADIAHGLMSGVLLHGLYLCCVWWAVRQGVPAGVSGLMSAVQPLTTAMLAPALLGERIGWRARLGIAIGALGLGLVLWPKLAVAGAGPVLVVPIIVNIIGVLSVTAGSFYQKRFVPAGDLRTVALLQFTGALLVTLPASYLLEEMHITWNATTIAVVAWSAWAISLGAVGLFLILIRRGAVSRAAALIYLVPPTAALLAWLFFGETLQAVQLVGMVATVGGVVLARRG